MRFNARGIPVTGRGRRWLTDTQHIGQDCSQGSCCLRDQHGTLIDARDATIVAAGGGKYAGCLQSLPVYQAFSNFGFTSDGHDYVEDISLDGSAVVVVPVARDAVGLWGMTQHLGDVLDARGANREQYAACFNDGRIWTSRHGWALLPNGVKPFTAQLLDEDVILYHTHRWLVIQEARRPWGKVVAEAPTFYPDGLEVNGAYGIGWTRTQGDTDLRQAVVTREQFTDISALLDDGVIVVPDPPTPPVVEPPKESPVRIPNRFDIVERVNQQFPHLIRENSRETIREFYVRVVWALHQADPNFGFLSKTPPENLQEINGVKVALDAAAYKGSDQVIDFIGSATDGPGTGSIGWGEKPRRPSNVWVQPVPWGAPEPAPPRPAPTDPMPVQRPELVAPVATLRALAAQLAALPVPPEQECPPCPLPHNPACDRPHAEDGPSYDAMLAMVGEADAQGRGPMGADFTAHLVWRFLREGYTHAQLVEEARARAQDR